MDVDRRKTPDIHAESLKGVTVAVGIGLGGNGARDIASIKAENSAGDPSRGRKVILIFDIYFVDVRAKLANTFTNIIQSAVRIHFFILKIKFVIKNNFP